MTNNEHLDDEQTRTLLGAFALDAVDDVERQSVERLLDSDPLAKAEVGALRKAADALGSAASTTAPAGLWESINREIESGSFADQSSSASPPTRISAARSRHRISNRPLFAAAAIVAIFVIGGSIFVGLQNDTAPTNTVATMTAMANDAAAMPGSRTGYLTDPGQTMQVKVIVDASGHGFIMTDPLPALPADETYQLWAADNGTMISLGMLGSAPTMSLVSINESVTELALTREPSRGSVSPTSEPMATGKIA